MLFISSNLILRRFYFLFLYSCLDFKLKQPNKPFIRIIVFFCTTYLISNASITLASNLSKYCILTYLLLEQLYFNPSKSYIEFRPDQK